MSLLESQGYLERLFSPLTRKALAYDKPGAWMPTLPPGCIRLSAGYPSPKVVPTAEIAEATARVLAAESDKPLHYLGSPAAERLPSWVQKRLMDRGVRDLSPDSILMTSGACQALDLVARVLLDENVAVVVEAPTYMEALEIFRNYTPNIISLPMDGQGMDVDALAELLERRQSQGEPKIRLLYTIPSFQNPTGRLFPIERRRQLLELAEAYDFLILEDDAYGELAFGEAPPPLLALETAGRVIHAGSLSKVVAPGLRIGWLAGPSPLVQACEVFKKDLGHPFSEAVVATYLDSIDFARRLQVLRSFYAAQRDDLLRAMEVHLPRDAAWIVPEGGYFVWVQLPGVDTGELLETALQAGVAYVPGKYFYFPEQPSDCLRLSFSYLPVEDMEAGVQRLASVL